MTPSPRILISTSLIVAANGIVGSRLHATRDIIVIILAGLAGAILHSALAMIDARRNAPQLITEIRINGDITEDNVAEIVRQINSYIPAPPAKATREDIR